MKRLRLSKAERQVLRMVAEGHGVCPDAFPRWSFDAAVWSLECAGLVRAAREEGGGVADAVLTLYGRVYIEKNPTLRNAVNWRLVVVVIAGIAIVAAWVLFAVSRLCG